MPSPGCGPLTFGALSTCLAQLVLELNSVIVGASTYHPSVDNLTLVLQQEASDMVLKVKGIRGILEF